MKKETIPFYLDKLDAAAKENNGYMALGRVCYFFYRLEQMVLFFGIIF